jgi:hypothetical protein
MPSCAPCTCVFGFQSRPSMRIVCASPNTRNGAVLLKIWKCPNLLFQPNSRRRFSLMINRQERPQNRRWIWQKTEKGAARPPLERADIKVRFSLYRFQARAGARFDRRAATVEGVRLSGWIDGRRTSINHDEIPQQDGEMSIVNDQSSPQTVSSTVSLKIAIDRMRYSSQAVWISA